MNSPANEPSSGSGTRRGRPQIRFIPLSTDFGKIRFFGILMPSLLLLFKSPGRFLWQLAARRTTPCGEAAAFASSGVDGSATFGDTVVFVHSWRSREFDPVAFARARVFLGRITRMVKREGYRAEPLDPLSPSINMPVLAASAGLGNLSPFGLLVHQRFGPRLIISALRTDHPSLSAGARDASSGGCTDCMKCVVICPQDPEKTGTIDLGLCQSCTRCLTVCPVGY
jgi:epoxyqueuosine reductase